MSELEQILIQRLEVAESKLMDLGWLRSSKGHYVAAREVCDYEDVAVEESGEKEEK